MKRREEGWIKNIKLYETRTPLSRKSHRLYFREFSGYDYYVDISLFVPLSVVFVLDIAAETLISRVLEEAVGRIARKVAEGKKLSDQEIVILYLDIIMRSNEKRFETIDKRFNDLREYTDKKFESIDRRFEAIDKRFDDLKEYVDKRINDLKDYVDKRFEAVDKRFESLEKRIEDLKGYVDKRLEDVDKRLESLERRVELVYNEVSSIKTDIIKMMKEYMERLYGDKKG
jgi:chaperonin cofactor prefoldin